MRYLPKKFPRTIIAAIATLIGAGAVPAVADAESHPAESGHAGYVYVNDNTAGQNTIAAFARRADGTLSPVGARRSQPAEPAPGPDSRLRARYRSRATAAM